MAKHTMAEMDAMVREEYRRADREQDLRLHATITLAIGCDKGHVTKGELAEARAFAEDYRDCYMRCMRKTTKAFRESFNALLDEGEVPGTIN
jgi:hypothetical protein